MANVFISLLGTNNYKTCSYFFGESYETKVFEKRDIRFVQEATIEHFCSEWTAEDRIFIFATPKAYELNWCDNGHRDRKTNTPIPQEGLGTRLAAMNLSPKVCCILIPEGKNPQEIWEIFEIIFQNLRHNDRIVFDITHALRSIPLLVLVILNYAKVVGGVSLNRIVYGAFETLGESGHVEAIPLEQRNAPIFDLTPFAELLDWTQAIDQFVRSGNANKAVELTKRNLEASGLKIRGKDRAHPLVKLAEALEEYVIDISTCRGTKITKNVQNLKEILKSEELSELPKPFKPLLETITQELRDFKGEQLQDGITAAQWCYDHNLIQQGFTILQESLITHIITTYGKSFDLDSLETNHRTLVNRAMHGAVKRRQGSQSVVGEADEKPKTLDQNFERVIEELEKFFLGNDELLKMYQNLTQHRNDLMHCGYRTGPMSGEKFREKLKECVCRAQKYAKGG